MTIYFFDKNQTLIKIAPDSATFEAIQTQELDDDSLLKDTLSVTVKGDEKLLDAEYMAVKSYTGNAQTFDMYRIVTDTTPDKSMSFTGMSLAPYELNGYIIQDLRPANRSLEYTLNRVLTGTDWRLGYVDSALSNVTTTFYYVSAKEALKELQSLVGCEFVFKVEISGQKITDKWIEVYSEMGNRTKKRFNYGTNALTVVRETNKADIYTALIGRGKGEEVSSGEDNESGQAGYGRKITFEDIEWSTDKGNPLNKPIGQYYLELPQATQAYGIKNIDGTMKARVGIVDFDDETDKNRLINLTYQQLLVSSRPKVLFKTTVANIGATGIGDTVTIHRHDLGIHYQTRVRKIVRNKLNDNKTQIELGDAVVTASTKRAKENNATIKNLNQELEKVKADVTTSQSSADGKNTIFYGSAEPERQRTGDTWFRPHPSVNDETQMLVWNGNAWELVVDSSDLTSVAREVEAAIEEAEKAIQSAQDADTRANEAIEKAGANANLLTTHQNALDAIKNTTIPNVSKIASDAMAEASSAMTEAQKADGKIADYVTKKGLVSGTTVDSKINDATGEISKKITTVEGKIDGLQVGGRNLASYSTIGEYSGGRNTGDLSDKAEITGSRINVKKHITDLIAFTINDVSQYKELTVSLYSDLDVVMTYWKFNNSNQTSKRLTKEGNFFVTKIPVPEGAVSLVIGVGRYPRPEIFKEYYIDKVMVEKGNIATDWSPASEDNLSQSEFQIFESKYDEDVKGINSTLTDLSNKKLDGTTYTNFYNNEYKKTAQGVTDTYAKVNKIIDANGNSTDTFAQAVYERNAERQKASFKEVTDNLVTTATYSEGVKGINQSISEVEGKIPTEIGGRNLILNSNNIPINGSDNGNKDLMKPKGDLFSITPRNAGNVYGNNEFITSETLVKGETYTLSFDIATKSEIGLYWYSVSGSTSGYRGVIPNTNGEIIRHTLTYKQIRENFKGGFLGGFYNLKAGEEIVFGRFKLEKGKIPTDWSPAPEDMQSVADLDNNITAIYNNTSSETAKAINKTLSAYTKETDFDTKTQSYLTNNQYQTAGQITTTLGAYTKTTSLDGTVASYLKNSTSATAGAINTKLTAYQTTTGLDSSVSSLLSNTNSQTAKGFNSKLTAIEGKIPTYVGGRNFLNYQNIIPNVSYIGGNKGDGNYFSVNNKQQVVATNQPLNTHLPLFIVKTTDLTSEVTISGTTSLTSVLMYYTLKDINGNALSGQVSTSINVDDGFFKKTLTIGLTANVAYIYFGIGNPNFTNYWIKPKLENGNVATDWQPAIEDMATVVKTNEIERTADYSKMAITNLSKNGVVESSSVNATKDGITERVAKVDANGNISYSNRDVKLNSIVTSVADDSYISRQIQTSNVIQSTIKSTTNIVDLSGAKTFTNLTGYNNAVSTITGYLIIRTPINSNNMVNIHIGGYNYSTNRSDIDIDVSFYRYNNTAILNHSYSNKGNFDFRKVQVGTDSAGRAVIVLGLANTVFSYPKITVDKAIIGHGNVPDSYIDGWSASISTDLTGIGSLTNIDGMEVQSQITQLADSIDLKVTDSDLISRINVRAGNVLITSGTNKLNVTPTTTYIENGTIKSAMIESIKANQITTGTLDASKITVNNLSASSITTGVFDASKFTVKNLDASSITANHASLIEAGLRSSSGGTLELSGDQLLSTASDGSQVYLQNGVVGVRRPTSEGGGSIGQIGYVYDGGSPTYTIQTSWGSHFALKQRFYDTYTKTTNDKRAIFVSTGDGGATTMQFYAKDFVLQGDRNLRFGYDHYINGIGNDLTLTGHSSVTVRAKETTVFVVSSNGKNNYASMYANLNMAGNTVTNTSDIRLKRDIVNDEIDSLSALMKWQHAGFNYINPDMNQERQFSVIAQSAPDLSFVGEDGYLQVSLNKQVNMTSHALQQHVIKTNDEITRLKAQVASLQDELALLKGA